jgi:CRISPR-associated protein Csm4
MKTIHLVLTPRSAFGTRPRGDTLFGQLCWAIRYRFGNQRLVDLLGGYLSGEPFVVVSDAMPAGYVPRPLIPLSWLGDITAEERKSIKKKTWLPTQTVLNSDRWLTHASSLSRLDASTQRVVPLAEENSQPHNSISRLTGTTGSGEFAPYQMEQIWYRAETTLDCHVVYDPDRIRADDIAAIWRYRGDRFRSRCHGWTRAV